MDKHVFSGDGEHCGHCGSEPDNPVHEKPIAHPNDPPFDPTTGLPPGSAGGGS